MAVKLYPGVFPTVVGIRFKARFGFHRENAHRANHDMIEVELICQEIVVDVELVAEELVEFLPDGDLSFVAQQQVTYPFTRYSRLRAGPTENEHRQRNVECPVGW